MGTRRDRGVPFHVATRSLFSLPFPLSPVAACSHGAAGTVQAVVLPDNLPPRDNIGGSNDPLVLHSQRPSE